MAEVIYRKYRPIKFCDVIGQDHVVNTIQNQFSAGSISHAYLFTGPRGIGKTTTARLLARLVNCKNVKENEPCNECDVCVQIINGTALDIYEIDAASHTDVEHIRENIIKGVRFAPNQLNKKVYIIDEVHMLSISAFNALLKTLEEPPGHALFVLATTEIHKIPDTIISRCQRFDFRRISAEKLVERLNMIAVAEGVEVDVDVLESVVRHSGGCARDAESLFGQLLALGESKITLTNASIVLPATNVIIIKEFIGALVKRDAQQAIEFLNGYIEQGVDLQNFIDETIYWLRDQMILAVTGNASDLGLDLIKRTIESFLSIRGNLKNDFIPQLSIELEIIKLCNLITEESKLIDDVKKKPENINDAEGFKKREVDLICEKKNENILIKTENIAADHVSEMVSSVFETEKKVFDTIPVIDIDEVKNKWPKVFKQIKACNASLPLFMQTCEISGVSEGCVELGFKYDLYVDAINKDKNRKLIESVLKDVIGKDIKVRAIKTKAVQESESLNELAKEFGGSVV